MARKKKTKSQVRLNKAIRMQETQQRRVSKLIGQMEMQGFNFSQKFKDSVMNTVESTASNATRKAKQLKGLTKEKLYQKAISYTTDDGRVWAGKFGVKRGRLAQRRKTIQQNKKNLSGLANVESALNSTDDRVVIDDDGTLLPRKEYIDKVNVRSSVLSAFDQWKARHPDAKKITREDLLNLERVKSLAERMTYDTTSNNYDSAAQKIINILQGGPLKADEVPEDDEEINQVGINDEE